METEEDYFCPARPSTPSPEESSSSEEDERKKALKSLKRSRELKSARLRKTKRIRKPDSSSEEEAATTEDPADYFKRKEKSAVRRILSSDEDESSKDEDDDGDSFIDDDDDYDGNDIEANEEDSWDEMMERFKRSDSKYRDLTSQYEESILDSRVTGSQYDLSDDEQETINRYPKKLLVSLREAVVDAHNDSETAVPEDVDHNDQLIQMWEMYDYREDKEKGGECVCGKTGLRHLFFMRVKESECWAWHTRVVGSECIKWFIRGNIQPNLGVIFKLLVDGVVATFRNRLATNSLEFSLGGRGSLPPVLLQHKNDHALDYKLPIKISESDLITMVVSAPTAKTRDQEGKLLKKGEKYRVFTKPSFKPSKDLSKIPIVDFILIKVVNLRANKSDASSTSTNQYKAESFIKI